MTYQSTLSVLALGSYPPQTLNDDAKVEILISDYTAYGKELYHEIVTSITPFIEQLNTMI